MKIKYVVAKINTSCRGNEEIKRFEFDDVESAIHKHIDESRKYQSESGYWNIFVEYSL